jgi:hypothetical protein
MHVTSSTMRLDPPVMRVISMQILRPTITVQELIEERAREDDPIARQYETFKIIDWKNGRLVECSCAPSEIANYFTESDKPFEISPAFFNPSVLTKYKADSVPLHAVTPGI